MNKDIEAIEFSKFIIEEQVNKGKPFINGVPFSKYQKVYFSTNENIKDYLNITDLSKKNSALSVMASGDQLFNLINKNILDIDTFDTNSLTEYLVLGLKYAMIKKYSYKEYLEVYKKLININTNLNEITNIINDLLIHMDEKYRTYWKSIINHNYLLQKNNNNYINLIHMLFISIEPLEFIKKGNNYLSNEEEYNKLRTKIDKANINFKCANAINLNKVFKKKYDVILLSNILDYFNKYYSLFDYNELKKYELALNTLLKDDGIIYLKYIFQYATKNYRRTNIFKNSNIKDSELDSEQIHIIKSIDEACYDGIILSKRY